jgi:cytochrome P450
MLERGEGDAAAEYAQQIPVRVIGHILGVPDEMSPTFTEWVRDVLEFAHDPERRRRGIVGIITYLQGPSPSARPSRRTTSSPSCCSRSTTASRSATRS